MHIEFSESHLALRKELRQYYADLFTPELRAALDEEFEEMGGPVFREVVGYMGRDGWLGLGGTRNSREYDLALLRCAELALEKEARYFVIDGGWCREPYRRSGSVVCKIKIFSERPTITDPSVLVYSAVGVQREMRSKVGLDPKP